MSSLAEGNTNIQGTSILAQDQAKPQENENLARRKTDINIAIIILPMIAMELLGVAAHGEYEHWWPSLGLSKFISPEVANLLMIIPGLMIGVPTAGGILLFLCLYSSRDE